MLREKKGLRSNDLAERSGISAQTISRLEKGHTDVSFSTLRKLLASMGYSLKDLASQELEFERATNQEISYNFLQKKLANIGIDRNLLSTKIIPKKVQEHLMSKSKKPPSMLLDEAASYVSEVFGWNITEIWNSQNLAVPTEAFHSALYKMPNNVNINQIKAYSHYSYYISNVVLKATNDLIRQEFPLSTDQFLNEYLNHYEKLEFDTLLDYIWTLGIVVIPLNDSGLFHGASWKIKGRHVIVVKQNSQFHARWIFDLLHEFYHVLDHLQDGESSAIIETEEISPISKSESLIEREANSFANLILFNGKSEEYVQSAVEMAKWNISNLSASVKKIAKKNNVRVDSLANYVAFRLSLQNQNWWGHATKLQVTEPHPYDLVLNKLQSRLTFSNLTPLEENLLKMAMENKK